MSSLRCPYCHSDVHSRLRAVCSCCNAVAHPGCAIELGRCAACAGPIVSMSTLQAEGWQRVRAGVGEEQAVAFLASCTREPPVSERVSTEPVSLELDLLRRGAQEGGVVAGQAVLSVPSPAILGALTLQLVEETLRPGLFGVRSRLRPVRCVRLLGTDAEPLWKGLFGRRKVTGIYAPGRYLIPFRLPLEGVYPTVDLPGAAVHRRLRLTLRLERSRGAFEAALEVVVTASRAPKSDPLLARS